MSIRNTLFHVRFVKNVALFFLLSLLRFKQQKVKWIVLHGIFFYSLHWKKNKQQSLCFCSLENQIDRSKHAHDRINEEKKKYLRGLCYL